jgi:small subunit ribosomal protein S6
MRRSAVCRLRAATLVRFDQRRPHRSQAPRVAAGRTTHDLLPRKDRGRLSPQEVSYVLRHYEIMVILDPNLEERTVAPSIDQYLNVIRNAGGSVEKLDVWGRRRLAYEINKKAEGIYAVIDLQATPEAVAELDRQLRLNELVLRTKVIRPEVR